ncbi:hypothetical protein [Paraburkholderia sp. BL10I2N1]|uniref:hypothetical protein n=1 Tax=Paraburkholderia sp. BL10I2N1 TaxID=1938796 RepID=UPI001414DDF3|nr:hypothetical protein [Paraburkholderia sp. BL10I2N1]
MQAILAHLPTRRVLPALLMAAFATSVDESTLAGCMGTPLANGWTTYVAGFSA